MSAVAADNQTGVTTTTVAAVGAVWGQLADRLVAADPTHPLRLGLLGGTFDPVHYGHLLLAQSALEQCQLDGVLLIPNAYPFYKTQLEVTDAAQRLTMLRLATVDDQRLAVSTVETDRQPPCYTVDTLQQLIAKAAGRAQFHLILGADALADLPHWKSFRKITELVQLVYARRPGTADQDIQQTIQAERLSVQTIDQPLIDISSSQLRQRVATGRGLRYYTSPPVADFIATNGLYRSSAADQADATGPSVHYGRSEYADQTAASSTLSSLSAPVAAVTPAVALDWEQYYARGLNALKQRLSAPRLAHSVAVAQTAAELAQAYGLEVGECRLAGLLHDWDKDLSPTELLAAAERYGLAVPDHPEKLLHAWTGARAVAAAFPELPPEIPQAIARHTLGDREMSDLDMVIYVADLIEPTRQRGDFAELRAAVGQIPLAELYRRSLQLTLEYLISRQRTVHLQSWQAWNAIIQLLQSLQKEVL
ncbi:MAG: nicotinate-nucleotide adenylyltransferase [Actinomycetia bacterium]|nr:nicotinate-nucleotide adenylyltransferase [Actinomycetes bacterium]